MDGSPILVRFFEDISAEGIPTGRGHMDVSNPSVQELSLLPGNMGLGNLAQNSMAITQEMGHRSLRVFASADPDKLFLWFDLPTTPKFVEVEMRTPAGMIWGKFTCINASTCNGNLYVPN